jgi:DNA-binding CsgD family transcriptional regulator
MVLSSHPPPDAAPIPPTFAKYLPPALSEVNVPAYVLDNQGRIRWLNDAARALTGDAVGKMFTSVLEPGVAERARPIFEQNIRGAPRRDYGVDLVGPDGGTTRVEISSAPLGPSHHAVGMFGLAVPAGERKTVPLPDARLTPRQLEVLAELAKGSSTEQIAKSFFLSRETVRNHVRHILQRLGARSRLEAVAIARRDNLV